MIGLEPRTRPRAPFRCPGSCAVTASAWLLGDLAGEEPSYPELASALSTSLAGTHMVDIPRGLARYGLKTEIRIEGVNVAVDTAPSILSHPGIIDGHFAWPSVPDDVARQDAAALGYSEREADEAMESERCTPTAPHAIYLRASVGRERQVWDPAGGYGIWRRDRLLAAMHVAPVEVDGAKWLAMAVRSIRHLASRLGLDGHEASTLIGDVGDWQRLAQVEASLEHVDYLESVGAIAGACDRRRELGRLLARLPARCERRHRWSIDPVDVDLNGTVSAFGIVLLALEGQSLTTAETNLPLAAQAA